jgi:hypothetical protein
MEGSIHTRNPWVIIYNSQEREQFPVRGANANRIYILVAVVALSCPIIAEENKA